MTSLQYALRLNAASCLVFGAVFAAIPQWVAVFLGSPPAWVILGIGIALLLNGAHLFFASLRRRPVWGEILWFSIGDMIWWLGALGLAATRTWVETPGGTVAAWAVAIVVAGLGLWQLTELGRARTGLGARPHLARIGRSWMGLPLWVRLWLFGLNGVFLAALAFVPSDMARVVLTGYVASGPLLAAFALAQGGLTRAAGLGHLLPWVPMLGWLAADFPAGAQGVYAGVLAVCAAICLGFDVYDTARWLKGERAVIGLLAQ